ncbi:MAG: LysM peptidoglycan-binding domain-containing protein [Acidimicrobiales bacterium]
MTDERKPVARATFGATPRRRAIGALLLAAVTVSASACGRDGGDDEIGVGGTTSIRITTTTAVSQTVTSPPTTVQLTYIIQSGDSLSVIAERFGISTKELADFNAIADVHAIQVGQELAIPPTTAAPATTASTAATTTSAPG